MPQSRAVIGTAHASRYLQQLCKHWAHRFETEFGETAGRVALPLGETRFAADATALTIDLTAQDAERLSGLRDVVVRHLDRFAFRETLHYTWTEGPPWT